MRVKNVGKAFLLVFVILSLLLPSIVTAADDSSYNNVVMMPVNDLALQLGGTFIYNHSTLSGVIKVGENELSCRLDNSTMRYNGKYIAAPAPMKIINNRFMIPVDFTKGLFGIKSLNHIVVSGDTLWKISVSYGVTVTAIKSLNGLTNDMIYIGQTLIIKKGISQNIVVEAQTTQSATLRSGAGFNYGAINYVPAYSKVTVMGKVGDWYKVNTIKGIGYIYYTVLQVTQNMTDSLPNSNYFNQKIPVESKNYTSYSSYIVKKGDTIWSISQERGITLNELANANGLSTSAYLSIGQVLKIPMHVIAVKPKQAGYGEILDWFSEGQYVFSTNAIGTLTDIKTGKSFMIQRTMGASHADVEPLSLVDTQIMKDIFGGFTWERRPFLLKLNNRELAVSVSGMPHAGLDSAPYLQNISDRSDSWGYGPNYDKIKGNGMDGHFDLYFLNSVRHNDGQLDPQHQYGVLKAGGLR